MSSSVTHDSIASTSLGLVAVAIGMSTYASLSPQSRSSLLKVSALTAGIACAIGVMNEMSLYQNCHVDLNAFPNNFFGLETSGFSTLFNWLKDQPEESSFETRDFSILSSLFKTLEKVYGIGCHNFIPFHEISNADIYEVVQNKGSICWSNLPYLSDKESLITAIYHICEDQIARVAAIIHMQDHDIVVSGNSPCFPSTIDSSNIQQFQELYSSGSAFFAETQQKVSLIPGFIKQATSLFHFFTSRAEGL